MATILTAVATVLLAIVVIKLIKEIYEIEKRMTILEALWIGTENRCPECILKDHCPAAFSGVAYPCEHFEKEDADGNEE